MLVGSGVRAVSPGALLPVGAESVVVAGAEELVTVTLPLVVAPVPPSVFATSCDELQLDAPKAAMSASTMNVKVTRAGVQKTCGRASGCLEEVMRLVYPLFVNGLSRV